MLVRHTPEIYMVKAARYVMSYDMTALSIHLCAQ